LRIEFGEVPIPEVVHREVTANDLKGSRAVKLREFLIFSGQLELKEL
jgi:hypothetical protein